MFFFSLFFIFLCAKTLIEILIGSGLPWVSLNCRILRFLSQYYCILNLSLKAHLMYLVLVLTSDIIIQFSCLQSTEV